MFRIVASIFTKIVLFKYNNVWFKQRFTLNNYIVVRHVDNEKKIKHRIVETTLSRAATIWYRKGDNCSIITISDIELSPMYLMNIPSIKLILYRLLLVASNSKGRQLLYYKYFWYWIISHVYVASNSKDNKIKLESSHTINSNLPFKITSNNRI
jgi:hypothetical protein